MKKIGGLGLIGSILLSGATYALTLAFPNSLTTLYPGIDGQYSPVNFNVQNGFGGMFFWRNNVTVAPTTVQVGIQTVTGCTQQLRGLYYNNQRGARLWPIDQNTLTGLQTIDSGYNAMTLTGGLFTSCSGKPAGAVYGAVTQYRGNHAFHIIGGVNYDFVNKTWLPTFGQTLYKYSNTSASGWIFDSQGAIGQMLGSFQCGNTIIEAGEQCDDGNQNNNDSCSNTCTLTAQPVCGNAILQGAEQCDDGNTNNNDGCSAQCTFEIPQTCGLSGNLVPNPGFESYIQCPTDFSHFTGYAASWYSPSPNADYMRLGCPFGTGIASAAQQFPHGGSSGMVHILTYASNIPGAGREYIAAQLVAPMQIGKRYNVGFCYATTAISNYISDKIGMLFSTGTYPTNVFWSAITQTPQFEHTGYIVGTGWTCVSGTILADKAYERFTIGSFHTNSGQSMIPNPMWNSGVAVPGYDIASYVIDDVFVSEECASSPAPYCGDGIKNGNEQCDGGISCNSNCTNKTSGGGGGTPSNPKDVCPDGDYSSSYYDKSCGKAPKHDAAPIPEPIGKACIYSDEQYLTKGPFTDTISHWGYPYTELMRISCLHRGRGTSKGLWIYEPNGDITRAEAIKTFVKILGIEFKDFTIQTEDKLYPNPTQFADVGQDNWFAWYVDYAAKKGLLDGLVTIKDGKQYLNPDAEITRYESIKLMMLAYDMIDKSKVALTGRSVMGDVIDANNPYFQYIRKAELLGFISGVPQQNGSYNFEGQRDITRAEFAKIVSVPFADQMFDILDLVQQSGLYRMVIEAINKSTSDKTVFAFHLFAQLESIPTDVFIKQYKVQKKIFLDTLKVVVMKPLLEAQEEE